MDLTQLLGGQPDYLNQLLTPEQLAQARERAGSAAFMGGLAQLLGATGPQARPVGTGQALGQALLGGMQGYQGSMDRTLTDMAKSMQIGEMQRKQKEAQQIKSVLASAATPQYTYGAGEEGATKTMTGMNYDMKSVIPTLQALGRFDLIKDISESQKALRQSGIMAEGTEVPSPFAPYVTSESPEVQKLAKTYEEGFRRGVIDEETAFKRIDSLARMEDSYRSKQASAQERADRKTEGKKPTEGERNAAGFVQRMEFSEEKIKDIEGGSALSAAQGGKAETPYATATTQFLGGIPLVGDFARTKAMNTTQQQYRQAQENWVRANLRKESGAAIGADEMDREIATYFPMPGDKPEVIAQKAQARQVTINAMRKAAGNAYEPFDMSKFMRDNGLEGRK
jgi:hypothetical protein